jgi:hypothetical protein
MIAATQAAAASRRSFLLAKFTLSQKERVDPRPIPQVFGLFPDT